MVDYSKWDKLELSDDSDIEVHPNVDKDSFIRWKQRDIHEKRLRRHEEMRGLTVQKEMYTQLNGRALALLAKFNESQLADKGQWVSFLDASFDPSEKCTLEGSQEDSPSYNQMVQDLYTDITEKLKKAGEDASDGHLISTRLKEHEEKIKEVLEQIDPKLAELEAEDKVHITSEDYHVGFDSSFINKKDEKKEKGTDAKKTGSTESVEVVETINDVRDDSDQHPSKPIKQLGELECLPETMVFSQIPEKDLDRSARFVKDHLYIACEQQKDSLMMKAFDSELAGDTRRTHHIVYQALLLQYLDDLFRGAAANHSAQRKTDLVDMFVAKISDATTPAYGVFTEDFDKMYKHIVERSKVIREEEDAESAARDQETAGEEGVEQIQLRSMDEDSELVVELPAKGSKEYESFETLPDDMKKALETKNLDEINKVFAKMSVEDAEGILDTFDKCGVIQVQAVLENEEEFDELKEKYAEPETVPAEAVNAPEKAGKPDNKPAKSVDELKENTVPSTMDIVD